MSLLGIHIALLSDAQHKIVKQALADAGHELVSFAGSETDKLVAAAKAKFPDLVADIKKGIADATDVTASGGDKAVAVALDVLQTAPDVIKALPNAKDFLVSMVTSVYADGLAELEKAAGELVAKLL